MRIGYRVRQFWTALHAAPTENELSEVRGVLSPSLMALFLQMQPGEQAHSLRIYRGLCDRGETHPDLLVAALLHDVGKSCHPLRLWERVLIVLAQKLFGPRVKAWGHRQSRGWRRAFVVAEQHPAWGAELAAQAGASPLAVRLIRRHQETLHPELSQPPADPILEDRLLVQLQLLDNQN